MQSRPLWATDYYYRYVSDSYCWLQIVTLLNVNGIESNRSSQQERINTGTPLEDVILGLLANQHGIIAFYVSAKDICLVSEWTTEKTVKAAFLISNTQKEQEARVTWMKYDKQRKVTLPSSLIVKVSEPQTKHSQVSRNAGTEWGSQWLKQATLPYPRSPQRYVHRASIRHLLCIYWPTFLHAASNTIKRMPTTSGENASTASHGPCSKLHAFAGRLSLTPILVDWERVCLQTNKQITSTVHLLTHQRRN